MKDQTLAQIAAKGVAAQGSPSTNELVEAALKQLREERIGGSDTPPALPGKQARPAQRDVKPIDPSCPISVDLRTFLGEFLSIRREHGSLGEAHACKKLVGYGFKPVYVANQHGGQEICAFVAGNMDSEVAIMAHIDTVHYGDEDVIFQQVTRSIDGLWSFPGVRGCLGADDGAGVAAILTMMPHRPDLMYVIHRGEECGGLGASAIQSHPFVKNIKVAISIDRAGYGDVINNQSYGTCCSPEFGGWLADQLSDLMPGWRLWRATPGVYTDSAEYGATAPECTNLSCGYKSQHTSSETLDESYLIDVTKALIALKFDNVPVVRTPSPLGTRWSQWDDYYDYGKNWHKSYGYKTTGAGDPYERWEVPDSRSRDFGDDGDQPDGSEYDPFDESLYRDKEATAKAAEIAQMRDLLSRFSERCARVLYDYGFTADALEEELWGHLKQENN